MTAGLTDGFEQYFRPDSARVSESFPTALIVLDANVLLNVLRYSPVARGELLDIVETVGQRVFVPYQVAVEYNRHRVGVVVDRRKEFAAVSARIETIKGEARGVVNSLKHRRTLAQTRLDELDGAVTKFIDLLQSVQQEATDAYDLNPGEMAGRVDPWTARLNGALRGRVGSQPTSDLLAADTTEGERRKKEKLAPGFKDDGVGDYLWWAEVLRHPDLQGRDLIVVSDDAGKGDWRFEDRGGYVVGPHQVLLRDVESAGGGDLFLLTTHDLLQLVGGMRPDAVSRETLEESESVIDAQETMWGFEAYHQLLLTLTRLGHDDRVRAIQVAAENGGFISRQQVYGALGVDEESRSLRHFATPTQMVKPSLVSDGLLSSRAGDPLVAQYDGPGKTIGYRVPEEFIMWHDLRDGPV